MPAERLGDGGDGEEQRGPARLEEVESEAAESGLKTRRTGTSVSILGVNGFKGYEGQRRAANLEDVFVLLTGEEIA